VTGAAATGDLPTVEPGAWGVRERDGRLTLSALVATALVALATISSATANPDIEAKRAHAQEVYNQYLELEMAANRVAEEVNGARLKLAAIEADFGLNTRHLGIAKKSLRSRTSYRGALRAIYMEGRRAAPSRSSSAPRISTTSSTASTWCSGRQPGPRVLGDVREFRTEVLTRRAKLRDAKADQARLVAEIDAKQRELARRRDARSGSTSRRRRRSRGSSGGAPPPAAAAAEARRRAAAAAAALEQARVEAQNRVVASPRRTRRSTSLLAQQADFIPDPTPPRGPVRRCLGSRCSTSASRTSGGHEPVRFDCSASSPTPTHRSGLAAPPCRVAVQLRHARLA